MAAISENSQARQLVPIALRLGDSSAPRGKQQCAFNGECLAWTPSGLNFKAPQGLSGDREVSVDLRLPDGCKAVLFPAYFGHFERWEIRNGVPAAYFLGAGALAELPSPKSRLALPFCLLECRDGLWILGVDPEFCCSFEILGPRKIRLAWKYLAAGGNHDERRAFLFRQVQNPTEALEAWHSWAAPKQSKPPAWLKRIAFQNYDYFSKNGKGWFEDINAACRIFETSEERDRAMFTLHGWYGQIGHYAYDAKRSRLEKSWEAMPLARVPEFLKFDNGESLSATGIGAATYRWRNLENYHPVPMTWGEMRKRLSHAKKLGFRTCLYILTGMQYPGERHEAVEKGTALDIDTPLWKGPDNFGPTHLRNPLHPEVREWALGYTRALIEKVGDLCDAFVIDESYYIPVGTLGPASCPGYADRAQLHLFREMHALCRKHNIALLAADQLGLPLDFVDARSFPYSLGCDGIYQDSAHWPDVYDATRFPCWNKPVLICNWAPKSNFLLMERAVLKHGADVAWSNGCFGDDLGLAELDEVTFSKFKALCKFRLSREISSTALVKNSTTSKSGRQR